MTNEFTPTHDPTSYLDALLDAALADSFPASDPVAISLEFAQHLTIPKPVPATQTVRG